MLAIARSVYANEWKSNAAAYQAQGLYDQLARHLADAAPIRAVLDIGCGRGEGLAALRYNLPPDARLIGVDENSDCLEAAAALLGMDTNDGNIHRMNDALLDSGYYVSTYHGAVDLEKDRLTLVQTDVIVKDAELEAALNAAGPFDAITLWFSGVHKARSATELVRHFGITSDADHRTLVEDRALSIASERLRPGGVLHIVARAGALDIGLVANEMRLDYEVWLEDWPFSVEAVGSIAYDEPANGIVVRSRDAQVSEMPNYAISVLIRRHS